ncbi:MAG: YncE family protein [Marinilabiliales bacterium]|nr:YncE family protein [Marinilabiliales bacterium]
MKKALFSLLGGLLLILTVQPVSAQSGYKLSRALPLPGDGGWDYLSVQEDAGRLFVSHATMAQVVDLKSGKQIGMIDGTLGIHGIALVPRLNKGFTSNGRDSSVTVFDLGTLAVRGKIKVPSKNPDAILYEPFSGKILTFNGGSASATVLDPATEKVLTTLALDGKPEFPVSDGKGTLYVNIEDKNEISAIDTRKWVVTKSWSISPGEEPSGLALDHETHRLFSVCGNQLMVVSDAMAGKVLSTLPIGKGCDGVAFDPSTQTIFCSNGEGTLTVIREESPVQFKVIATVKTVPGARTIVLDKSTHRLYLSVADFMAPASPGKRPAIQPGTFRVLEVEPIAKGK